MRLTLPSLLKRSVKYIAIAIALILILFTVASFVVFKKKNDWLLSQIQSYMVLSQSGDLKIASIDLKLLRNFPDITLELDDVDYYELPDSVRGAEQQPIIHAEQVFIAVELLPLIQDELKITDISVSNATFNILEYANGQINLNRALAPPVKKKAQVARKKVVTKTKPATQPSPKKPKTTAPAKATLHVDLQSLSLNEIKIRWYPFRGKDTTVVLLQELEADLFSDEKIIASQLSSAFQIETLYLKNTPIPAGTLTIDADFNYDRAAQELTVQHGNVHYDIFTASLKGTYAHKKNQMLDLQIDASSNDLALLSAIIKPEVIKQNPDLLKHGDIYAKGRIFGELKKHQPQLEFTFGINDLDMVLPKNIGTFKNIAFKGKFSSGALPDYSQALFEIQNLRGQLPDGFLKGHFSLRNFVTPYLKYELHTQLKLDGYDHIFKINSLHQLRGSILLEAEFDGPIEQFASHEMENSRSSAISLNNLSFVVGKTGVPVTGLNGKILNRNNKATLEELKFNYGKNDFRINATIDNLVYFLLKGEREISAAGSIHANQLFTNDLLFDTLQDAAVQDRISHLTFDFQVKTLSRNVNTIARIDTIIFDIRNLTGKLDQLPDLKKIDAKGNFCRTNAGLKLDLREFHANMPQGKLDVVGDLLIQDRYHWTFNAKAGATKFPWTYVKELTAEIKDDTDPSAKNLPVNQMELITADLDVSASIITYPFDFTKLMVRNSRIDVLLPDEKILSVKNLDVSLDHLLFKHPENSGSLSGLKSTTGEIDFTQLKIPGLNAFDATLEISGKSDSLDIDFSSKTQKAASETGSLLMDISKKEIDYQLDYRVAGVKLEYFIQKYYQTKFMEGDIDYELMLHSSGASFADIKKNLTGTIAIRGDSLMLHGADIDNVLKKFKRSQNFNLTDIGAVLIAGPVGLAVTKGSDFVSLATVRLNPEHHTSIQSLLARWRLEHQQLHTEDVAFTTRMNRIAFNGSIDFANDAIPGLTIAVVDKNGCSLMDQKLHGKTNALQTGKLNITKTLLGSVINFANAVVGKDCKPVYEGKVKAPN